MRTWQHSVTIAAVAFACLSASGRPTIVAAAAACGTDMRVLVISLNGTEVELGSITNTLNYLATPFTVYNASKTPGGLTAALLSDGGCHANFQAVVETIGNVLEQSTLSA